MTLRDVYTIIKCDNLIHRYNVAGIGILSDKNCKFFTLIFNVFLTISCIIKIATGRGAPLTPACGALTAYLPEFPQARKSAQHIRNGHLPGSRLSPVHPSYPEINHSYPEINHRWLPFGRGIDCLRLKPRAAGTKPLGRAGVHGQRLPPKKRPGRGVSPNGLRHRSAGVNPRAGGGVVYARAIPITTSGYALVHPCVCPGWGIASTCSSGVITPPGAEAPGCGCKAP
jgi:hypothetical protein